MNFHVRVVPGGMMSVPLALRAGPGTRARIGPAVGSLQLDESSPRDILMVAGSTGLAPMLAMLERLAAGHAAPAVHLYFGARDPDSLYALDQLLKMENELPWLTLTYAADAVPAGEFGGVAGSITEAMARGGPWTSRDAYVCGPPGMVTEAAGRLLALGVPDAQVHTESFGTKDTGGDRHG